MVFIKIYLMYAFHVYSRIENQVTRITCLHSNEMSNMEKNEILVKTRDLYSWF